MWMKIMFFVQSVMQNKKQNSSHSMRNRGIIVLENITISKWEYVVVVFFSFLISEFWLQRTNIFFCRSEKDIERWKNLKQSLWTNIIINPTIIIIIIIIYIFVTFLFLVFPFFFYDVLKKTQLFFCCQLIIMIIKCKQ